MRVTLDINGPDVGMLTETEIEDAVYRVWRTRYQHDLQRFHAEGSGFMAYVRATIER